MEQLKWNIMENYGISDFQDGNTGGNDYAYDANGNLTQDLNKGILSIEYTWFNKPSVIAFANDATIRYSYDAAGNKRQEKNSSADRELTTDLGFCSSDVYADNW